MEFEEKYFFGCILYDEKNVTEIIKGAVLDDDEFADMLREHRMTKEKSIDRRVILTAAAILRSRFIKSGIVPDFETVRSKLRCVDASMNVMFYASDFFTAPASTSYHGDWEGGLVDHSLAVLEAAIRMKDAYLDSKENKKLEPLWFLLHDVCKINCYELVDKNRKNPETGKWETVKGFQTKKDFISAAHGAESVSRIFQIMDRQDCNWMKEMFTDNWRLAIDYHMGLYSVSEGDKINYSNAIRKYPEILLMHHADMVASQIWKI